MKPSTLLTVALCACQFSGSIAVLLTGLASTAMNSLGGSNRAASSFGWVSIAMLVGAFLGPLVVWPLSRFLSRKQVMFVTIMIGLLGAILVTAAASGVILLIGAGFAGVSNAMIYITASLWQAENAEPHQRGKRIILQLMAGLTGYALGTWISFAFRMFVASFEAIRGVVSIQLIFLVVALGLVYFAPDSYRWLLSHNKPEEARAALARMLNQPQSSPAVTTYFNNLVQHRSQLVATSPFCSCSSARKTGRNPNGVLRLHSKRRLGLAIAVQAGSALSGIQAVSMLISSAIFGLFPSSSDNISPSALAAFLPTLDVLFLLMPYFLLPRLGMRKLLTVGSLGLALCLLISLIVGVVGPYSSFNSGSSSITPVVFTFLLGAFFFYDLSWTSLSWVLQAEIAASLGFNNENTATACVATAIRAAMEVGVAFAVVFGVNSIGYGILLVWLLLSLLFAILVWLFFPETVGRSLEDLDRYFARAPRTLVWRDQDAKRVKQAGGVGYSPMPFYGGGGAAEIDNAQRWSGDRWAQTWQKPNEAHELHTSQVRAPQELHTSPTTAPHELHAPHGAAPPAYDIELEGYRPGAGR